MTRAVQVAGVELLVEGEGPHNIVMIHGWPDTHRLWDSTVQAVRGEYRCIRFTLPGFEPGSPRRSYSSAELVATFKAIVEQACPGQRVTLLLHDWGCAFGYAFAAQHPELVSKIVGVDIGDAGSPAHLRSLRFVDKLMIVVYQGWLAIAWRLGGRVGEWMTRWMARALHCPSNPAFIASKMNYPYHRQWTGGDATPAAPAFMPACPMLYIYGTRKPFMFHSPAWAEALARRPGCQVLAFETGHWVMSRQPEPFNQALLAWLGRSPDHLA